MTAHEVSNTIYLEPWSEEGKKLIENLPDSCESLVYQKDLLYIFQKGSLLDYFDFDTIRSYYCRHGLGYLDWEKIRKYFRKPLSFFGDESKCGFSLQYGRVREELIIKGLILGYPIESTIAMLRC